MLVKRLISLQSSRWSCCELAPIALKIMSSFCRSTILNKKAIKRPKKLMPKTKRLMPKSAESKNFNLLHNSAMTRAGIITLKGLSWSALSSSRNEKSLFLVFRPTKIAETDSGFNWSGVKWSFSSWCSCSLCSECLFFSWRSKWIALTPDKEAMIVWSIAVPVWFKIPVILKACVSWTSVLLSWWDRNR